ncbi:hypothetical protein [Aeoliella sp. SH292]|uniref:hypothetical protein n=1 Tax=Aeoliella sp. SH292 TaxID=3454464 RepID=UPI003F9D7A16
MMISERDATRLWQRLFRGQPITALTFEEANRLIDGLPETSPLRYRLATELVELRARNPDHE